MLKPWVIVIVFDPHYLAPVSFYVQRGVSNRIVDVDPEYAKTLLYRLVARQAATCMQSLAAEVNIWISMCDHLSCVCLIIISVQRHTMATA